MLACPLCLLCARTLIQRAVFSSNELKRQLAVNKFEFSPENPHNCLMTAGGLRTEDKNDAGMVMRYKSFPPCLKRPV